MSEHVCQDLIYEGETGDNYYQCNRPAKAWVKDGSTTVLDGMAGNIFVVSMKGRTIRLR